MASHKVGELAGVGGRCGEIPLEQEQLDAVDEEPVAGA
jgi:hypothetical protein